MKYSSPHRQNPLHFILELAEQAISIIENLRANIVNPDLRTSYFASVQKYYRTYIDILMQLHKQHPNQGYEARALQASESARARGLLDLLTESHADIKKGADPKLVEQERTIQLKLNTLEKRRIEFLSSNKPIPPSFEQEYNTTNQQYQQYKDQIRISSPRYAALTQPKPLKLTEIQQLLDDNTIVLEYSLGKDHSYLWLISKTKLTSYELPKQADIEQLVKQYRSILTDRNHDAATINLKRLAPQLRQMLLTPIADQLGSKRLVIVADGALQYIPFSALPSSANNQPLLLTNEVIHLPSASSLGILRQQYTNRQIPTKTVAVLADPVFSSDDAHLANPKSVNPTAEKSINDRTLDRGAVDNGIGKFYRLINTKTEGEVILHLVTPEQGKLSVNFAANLDNVTNSDLSQYRIVHFATHGIMDSVDPKCSGRVLSLVNDKGEPQNGYLRLQDIFNLNLGADLVVLSACQTGIGKEIQGEGLVGLTRGFMYAGAPRVVVSLWNVDDEATSILMSKFYEGILKKGLPPSVALRQAQQAMMQNPNYQAPYYWAAFVLQGEWK
jgi:CHAT domain-containing protein